MPPSAAKPQRLAPTLATFDSYRPYLGSTYLARITDATGHAIMVIGRDRWSLQRFVGEVGSAHLRAARMISKIADLHRAKNLQHFYANSSPGSVAESGFGIACLFTLFRTFDAYGLDVTAWVHQPGGWETHASTFSTLKRHAKQREINEPKKRRSN